MTASEPCERVAKSEDSAGAALATVGRIHGLPIRAGEVGPLVGLPEVKELGDLVVAARLLGFDSVPLEGGYEELPEVPRPNIVRLRDRFVVLLDIDAEKARIADPLEGVRTLLREPFSAAWTGDCVQVTPADLEGARRRLVELRSLGRRLTRPRSLAFGLALVAVGAAELWGGFSVAALGIGVAALSALWLLLFPASCQACNRAHQLAGALPLERIGVFSYAALLGALRLEAPFLVYILAAAAGGHAALVAILARERLVCAPCLLTAAGVLVALGFSHPPLAALPIGVAGALALWLAVPWSRRIFEWRSQAEARRIAAEWLLQAGASEKLRVVVWKRPGCPACLFYESVWKVALVEEFGDSIEIVERDASRLAIGTPLILVAGALPVLFTSLGAGEDDYSRLQQAVTEGSRAQGLAPVGGMLIV
jgi:hypothetical protein